MTVPSLLMVVLQGCRLIGNVSATLLPLCITSLSIATTFWRSVHNGSVGSSGSTSLAHATLTHSPSPASFLFGRARCGHVERCFSCGPQRTCTPRAGSPGTPQPPRYQTAWLGQSMHKAAGIDMWMLMPHISWINWLREVDDAGNSTFCQPGVANRLLLLLMGKSFCCEL